MNATARVLLVEDDKFLRRACEASLRQRGFDVTTANDASARPPSATSDTRYRRRMKYFTFWTLSASVRISPLGTTVNAPDRIDIRAMPVFT